MMSSQAAGYKEAIEKELGNTIYLEGAMGVPITFLDKYNPDQFEIIDALNRYAILDFFSSKSVRER